MKVPGIEEVTETFLSASVVELNPHGNVDPKAGLLAVFETHVKGMLKEAFRHGGIDDTGEMLPLFTSAEKWPTPDEYAARAIAQLKEPRHD